MRIKNWEKFQHYQSGRGAPPWIKLYRDLLNDKEWHSLNPESAKVLISCWILAAEFGGKLPDIDTIAFRLRIDSKSLEKHLKNCSHWIILNEINDASKVLAGSKQLATPETETETEKTLVIVKPIDDCPHQEIVNVYHEILPELPRVKILTDKRKQLLKTRWREDEKRQDLEFWRRFFNYIRTSDFLMGKANGFQASFEWLITSQNFVKVIEGNYDNRSKPSAS